MWITHLAGLYTLEPFVAIIEHTSAAVVLIFSGPNSSNTLIVISISRGFLHMQLILNANGIGKPGYRFWNVCTTMRINHRWWHSWGMWVSSFAQYVHKSRYPHMCLTDYDVLHLCATPKLCALLHHEFAMPLARKAKMILDFITGKSS